MMRMKERVAGQLWSDSLDSPVIFSLFELCPICFQVHFVIEALISYYIYIVDFISLQTCATCIVIRYFQFSHFQALFRHLVFTGDEVARTTESNNECAPMYVR